MNRTPMKRGTGFKRQALPRVRTVHVPIPLAHRRAASMTPGWRPP